MFSSARALAAAGATAFALAAAAPAAQAEVRHVYDAAMTAGVSYSTEEASESGKVTRTISAGLGMNGWFRDLRFVNGALLTQRTVTGSRFYGVGADLRYRNDDAIPADVTDCRATAVQRPIAGVLNPLRAFSASAAPAAMGITPFSLVTLDLNCGVGGEMLGIGARSHRPGDTGPGHLRLTLTVPRDRLGDEVIRLSGRHTDRRLKSCPGGFVESDLRSCVTSVYVALTLYRTYEDPEDDVDLIAPRVPKRPTVERGARRGRATVRCPRGCRYRIRIFEPPRRGRGVLGRSLPVRAATAAAAAPRASASAAALATRAGRLPAGRASRTVSVTIPATERAALVEAGAAVISVELDPPRGRTTRATFVAPVAG